jgi:hypothetical protein
VNPLQKLLAAQVQRLVELSGMIAGLAQDCGDRDPMDVVRLIAAVDSVHKQLARLADRLQPGLFDRMRPRRRHRKTAG